MCLNCGCGEYEKRHKPADITMDDLKAAAKGLGMGIGETSTNREESGRSRELPASKRKIDQFSSPLSRREGCCRKTAPPVLIGGQQQMWRCK